MEQNTNEEDSKVWVLDTLQKIEELRADILQSSNIFTEDEAVKFDNTLENVKTELSKLLIPTGLSDFETRMVIKNAMVRFSTVGILIASKLLIDCKKDMILRRDKLSE